MIEVKGYAAQAAHEPLKPWRFQRSAVEAYDVQIEILFCGVCHSDLHNIQNHWGEGIFPMVPGHEIVGRVTTIGAQVTKFKVGDLAAVGTQYDACRDCEDCKRGFEQFCEQGVLTYGSLDRNGRPTYGGYSSSIVMHQDFTFKLADTLYLPAVAPLLCAGITTYSPLRKWNVGPGHRLAVVGLGGLGHMAVKFAVAMGAEVTVISTSAAKRTAAFELGAQHFLLSSDQEQMRSANRHFDFILDSVAKDHDIEPYLQILRTNGTYINVGLPPKPWQVAAFSLVAGNKTITGSGVGGLREVQEMLDFCAVENIVADIELIAIQDIHAAFERMERGDVRYRFVIDMASL